MVRVSPCIKAVAAIELFDTGMKRIKGRSIFVSMARQISQCTYLDFTEPSTGHTQWEPPIDGVPQLQQDSPPQPQGAPPTAHTKRRQYAAGQSQAYSGAADLPPVQPHAYSDPSTVGPSPALFTPGLDQTQMQSQQYYGQPGAPPVPPSYGQAQSTYGQQMNQMTDQFAHMGMGGQKPVSLSELIR
jgi:protein transport protein SEC24